MKEVFDTIIIGAGPAGLTSAIYLARADKKVLVLEKDSFGGQILNTKDVENYPGNLHISGFELAKKMFDQATELGAKIEFEKVNKISDIKSDIKTVETEDDKYLTKSIIIATGAKNRRLGLKNEEELIGRGISFCATCDGAFYREKVVAVVGGGDVAFEDALLLSELARDVFLIHRSETFRASEKTVEKVKSLKNIHLILNSTVKELIPDESGNLSKIRIKTGEKERELEISGLFVAIGQIPDTAEFSELLNLDRFGYIEADENCKTTLPGVFIAGDCRRKTVRQLVTATSDGAVSALSAINFLQSIKK